jgi:hypothetical protein
VIALVPGVYEAAVVRQRHHMLDEVPVAFVIPAPALGRRRAPPFREDSQGQVVQRPAGCGLEQVCPLAPPCRARVAASSAALRALAPDRSILTQARHFDFLQLHRKLY